MAKRILEIQKIVWEGMIAQLTEDYENGLILKPDYDDKINDLLDDLAKIIAEIEFLKQNEQE